MPLLSRSFSVLQVKGNQFSSKPNGPLTQTQVIFWGNIPHFFSEISYNYTKGEGAPLPHRTQPETKNKNKNKNKKRKNLPLLFGRLCLICHNVLPNTLDR
jgi:hypothetical protein